MFKDLFIDTLEKLINQYIKCDADYLHFLTPLVDKTLCVKVFHPPLTLHLEFTADSIKCLHCCYVEPNCTIRGESLSFLKLAHNKEASITTSNVDIEGDMQVAQDFADLCHNINIDWEEMLANVVGDRAAHSAGSAARKATSIGSQCKEKIQTDLQEFLHHESKTFPTRIEVDKFLDKIDTLRHDVDRLTARFSELNRNLG